MKHQFPLFHIGYYVFIPFSKTYVPVLNLSKTYNKN